MKRLFKFSTIDERNRAIIVMMLEEDLTIRQVAEKFKLAKSTVHSAIHSYIDRYPKTELALDVRKLLTTHFEERAVRGGMALAKLYRDGKIIRQCKKKEGK